MKRTGIVPLFLAVLFVGSAAAQNATTSLRGVVKDSSGAVVLGATVTLKNTAAGQAVSTTSKSDGSYGFAELPPAKYVITVSAPGFGSQSKVAELLVNQPATVNFVEAVQGTSEVVDVTAETQTLNNRYRCLVQATGGVRATGCCV